MENPQLYELYDWLESNPNHRFEIYDYERKRSIDKCAAYEDITSGGKTPDDYFKELANRGVRTVQIVQKKKNGSSFKRESCGLNYSLSIEADNNVAASGTPVLPGATLQHSQNMGLMGASNIHGLGFSDFMSMSNKADRYAETKLTADQLQAKLDALEADHKRLDRENFILQNDLKREKELRQEEREKEPSKFDKLVDKLFENPAAIPHLAAAFKGGGSTAGLNAPAPQDKNLSDTKKLVIETIKNHTDENVTGAYYVLAMAEQNNVAFLKKYQNLLVEFNIIQDGSDSESDGI